MVKTGKTLAFINKHKSAKKSSLFKKKTNKELKITVKRVPNKIPIEIQKLEPHKHIFWNRKNTTKIEHMAIILLEILNFT